MRRISYSCRDGYPLPRTGLWVVFDVGNAHGSGRHYCWWFDSRSAAREFVRVQRAQARRGLCRTAVVGPRRYVESGAGERLLRDLAA
jgi:hypothetical protein